MEKKIGYEVVKVRGNASYTWEVYVSKSAAIAVYKVLTEQITQIVDEHSCHYEVRETRLY